jgi:cytochrome c-type biogenesis protein
MENVIAGFTLGNAAILTNVCLLPLYPGLVAFLAGNVQNEQHRRASAFLGIFVLMGVLSMMIAVGLVVFLLFSAVEDLLSILLPMIYLTVLVFGLMMLIGNNPFARLTTLQAPIIRNPYVTAYLYGLLLGPMTLPCTGPIITSAFAIGTIDTGLFADQMIFFLAFGFGFGWPLVVLPLFALPIQRRFTGWLSQNHLLLTRASGGLLLFIALLGFWELMTQTPIT